MTGLRVETAKQNKMDFYSKKGEVPKNRYLNHKGKPSPAMIEKRKRFMKLLSGGDVTSMLEPPRQLKDGQIMRSCRLYEEEKPPIPMLSPQKSVLGNKSLGDKIGD